jgi:hypothetical protein
MDFTAVTVALIAAVGLLGPATVNYRATVRMREENTFQHDAVQATIERHSTHIGTLQAEVSDVKADVRDVKADVRGLRGDLREWTLSPVRDDAVRTP